MKRRSALPLLLCLLVLLLTACGNGGKENNTTTWTTEQMAGAILAAGDSTAQVSAIRSQEAQFASYAEGYYRLNEAVEEGTILYVGGVSALEVAVFRLAGDADTAKAEAALQAYIDGRAGAFTGYAPEEAAVLEQSGTAVRGQYVALLICPNQEAAQAAFASAFQGGPAPTDPLPLKNDALVPVQEPEKPEDPEPAPPETPEEPPEEVPQESPAEAPSGTDTPPAEEPPAETPAEQLPEPPAAPEEPPAEPPAPPAEAEWQYDHQRLADAWEAGDWSGLAEKDRAILDKCKEVIDALITDNMSLYDKELAIHDWMIAWADYDRAELDNHDHSQADPDNDNPYGLLVGRKGICLGYTYTFRLFMDLLDIECTVVHGASHGGADEHAWNMVRLDGEWYCVDVTWDDPITSSPFPLPDTTTHMYFNVTSDFLRRHDHQWDETAVEEAKGTALAWAADY